MIAIMNVSKVGTEDAKYYVHINHKFICEFKHKRSDGLAECLRRAADAVDKSREDFVNKILEIK